MRVLIVDDNPLMRQMMREWIAAEGSRPLEAVSAEDALITLSAHGAPAAVITDIQLPGKDGIWLAQRLQEEYPQTAVVTTTASRDLDLALNSFHAGAVDHLIYPFTVDRVTGALTRARVAHLARKGLADMQKEVEKSRAETTSVLAELQNSTAAVLEAILVLRRSHNGVELARAHRTAALAVNLALMLQVSEPELSAIERAVFLQDAASLPTPGELDSLAILRHVPLFADACDIALAVHERFDGSGFPHGLQGTDIPLSARIIAVAAAYEALASSSPDAHAAPLAVVQRLCGEGAADFDPAVLDALRKLHPMVLAVPEAEAAGSAPYAFADLPMERMVYAPRVADSGPAPADRRRRWTRKRLAAAVAAEIGGKPARVVEVSYGGFRIESATPEPAAAGSFALDIPGFRIHAEATCKWSAPKGLSGSYSCGAAVADSELASRRWRALVDALPQQPPGAAGST
jgi:response regulator RpfG family c-di-GMP phosphodiesterase